MSGAWVRPRRKQRRLGSHELRNPKSETRRKPKGQSPKCGHRKPASRPRCLRPSAFGFRPSFGLRPSDFGLQTSAFGLRVMSVDLKYVDEAVARLGRSPDAVIPILQALQDHYGYLPEEALRRVCAATQITPAGISGVSTFYDMFRHEPSGKHIVHVCHGTACHVGGAERVEDALRRHLHIPDGSDTDADRRFTIERVACLGCCTLAPVVRIEQETIGSATFRL